ncbi:predicted protein [Streptomyces sviceus ATCC 29083]|uniref:CopC domain-containing protein n=1 Tax=Streptomyces sviceus (strain ATCC 29083 / DSM 924 / JCM 4929 / NBRC 13980 / NCIMB 11184 / NRRL 5439 / UC 5370) TaxID=463191 RepID=D6XBP3_STRX2|nr:predicted protein [Streptomyces sviceus ATCC 29083]
MRRPRPRLRTARRGPRRLPLRLPAAGGDAMRPLLVLAALLCALLGAAQPASAHTELVSSSPKDGATPAKAPDHLTLTFDEVVDLARVRVLTVDGDRLPVARTAKDNVVRVALGSPADGKFAVVWSVVDEGDGHASSGRIAFAVGAAPARTGGDEAQTAAPAPSPSVRKGLVAVRWAGYLALALFIGGLAFVALLWPGGAYDPRARALLGLAWTAGLLATVAAVGLQGAYASLGGLRDALRPATYADVLATEPGVVLAARGLMWVLAAVVLAALLQGAARSPGWRVGALAVAFGLLRTTGMTGHNSEGSAPTWGAVADFVHLLGAALWIGGLAMLALAVLPRRRPAELAEVVPGYARLAALSVTGIVEDETGDSHGRWWGPSTASCTPPTGICCSSRQPSSGASCSPRTRAASGCAPVSISPCCCAATPPPCGPSVTRSRPRRGWSSSCSP